MQQEKNYLFDEAMGGVSYLGDQPLLPLAFCYVDYSFCLR
jgi:hypothetical protein